MLCMLLHLFNAPSALVIVATRTLMSLPAMSWMLPVALIWLPTSLLWLRLAEPERFLRAKLPEMLSLSVTVSRLMSFLAFRLMALALAPALVMSAAAMAVLFTINSVAYF
jgi:hypothetical protein